MPRAPRRDIVDRENESTYHCGARCVRRTFLCGIVDGISYEHRKVWIKERLEFLAAYFAVDVLCFAVMSNHYHVLLRIRPDLVKTWSPFELAWRWVAVCQAKCESLPPGGDAFDLRVLALMKNPAGLERARRDLSDLSWFMANLNEYLSRRANREDELTGTFWEKRFSSTRMLDEAATLANALYIDLNAVRALMAATPEESTFTSAYLRIQAQREQQAAEATGQAVPTGQGPDRWISPIPLGDTTPGAPAPEIAPGNPPQAHRASNKGILNMSAAQYLELLDWTGRQPKAGKPGAIPSHLAPILERLGIRVEGLVEAAQRFEKMFKTVAGNPEAMAAEATKRELKRMPGMAAAKRIYR